MQRQSQKEHKEENAKSEKKGGAEKEEAGEERLGEILEASRIVKCQRETSPEKNPVRKPKGDAKRGKPRKERSAETERERRGTASGESKRE